MGILAVESPGMYQIGMSLYMRRLTEGCRRVVVFLSISQGFAKDMVFVSLSM